MLIDKCKTHTTDPLLNEISNPICVASQQNNFISSSQENFN